MDGEPRKEQTPKRRRHLGAALGGLAALAAVAVVASLLTTSVPIRDATRLLAELDPNFDPVHYRAGLVGASADGCYCLVRFERIAGAGQESYRVSVPERRWPVRAARQLKRWVRTAAALP
jgi:hypothetical protein